MPCNAGSVHIASPAGYTREPLMPLATPTPVQILAMGRSFVDWVADMNALKYHPLDTRVKKKRYMVVSLVATLMATMAAAGFMFFFFYQDKYTFKWWVTATGAVASLNHVVA